MNIHDALALIELRKGHLIFCATFIGNAKPCNCGWDEAFAKIKSGVDALKKIASADECFTEFDTARKLAKEVVHD